MQMLTTSRYASTETRRLAKKIAEEKNEPFFARGKKTIAQLAALARRIGEGRISVIEERQGKAALIAELTVDEKGKWKWEKSNKFIIM